MPNNDEEKEQLIGISRKALLIKFIERLYKQENVKKICRGDYMVVPASKFEDWVHDMGVILGKSIQDLIDQ
jgi:hypothetical protein